MSDKFVIITGGSRGLGLETVNLLLKNNYKVIVVSRNESDDLKSIIKKNKDKIFFKKFDLINTAEIKNIVSEISREHGRVYGLINNAALGFDGILATMHEKEIGEIIKVNIEAPILLAKYVSRMMLLNNDGRIINIASIIASTGFNGLSVYAASKSALIGFTKSLSRELGKANITVNSISPGYLETDMTQKMKDDNFAKIVRRSPMNRLASLSDVSNAIIYLLSKEAHSVTGINLTIDAGSTA
tara:strand:+ start:154 stop:882 length:729 start_codon:yes stop_codon:yes gene_type:complete